MATPADPSYLTWQGVPHSLGQVPNHLSCYSHQYSSDTLETWNNSQPGWVPYCEGLPRCFGGLPAFSGGGPPSFPGQGAPGPPGPPGGGSPCPLASQEEAP